MITRTSLVATAGAFLLGACSSSSGSGDPTGSTATSAGGPSGSPTQRGPAASGAIAAISGTTMQVQNEQTGQVAVSWTASTKFTHQVSATIAAVKAGDCVTAVAASGTPESAASFTATSLLVSKPVNGSCNGKFGGNNGSQPSGSASRMTPRGPKPSGIPSGRSGGAVASGTVSSVSGTTLVIAVRQFGSNATTYKTVTISSATKITADAATTARSLKVGKCITADGTTDSTGAVTATSVRISDPVDGRCGGPGRFGEGGTSG
jgi:Domain of unknown function (DUF5666)